MRHLSALGLAGVAFLAWSARTAHADDRKFTYSYEAKTLPQGTWEMETWATAQVGKNDGHWSTLRLRDEIEYGVTDRLNGSIYLNGSYQANSGVPGFENEHSLGFDSMSTEWKYRLTQPSIDPVGVLLYEELAFSNATYELETKLVLSKEVGPWTFAYNLVWEAVLNRADNPAASPQWSWEHEISNTVGISYELIPSVAVGLEAVDIARYAHSLGGPHNRADYVGPNVHYSAGSWWVTLTFLRQVSTHHLEFTDPDNTRNAIRLIFGVNF